MDDWLGQLAMLLGEPQLSDEEQGLLLDVARDVAHGTERKATPTATSPLGIAVARRVAAGEDRHAGAGPARTHPAGLLPGTEGAPRWARRGALAVIGSRCARWGCGEARHAVDDAVVFAKWVPLGTRIR